MKRRTLFATLLGALVAPFVKAKPLEPKPLNDLELRDRLYNYLADKNPNGYCGRHRQRIEFVESRKASHGGTEAIFRLTDTLTPEQQEIVQLRRYYMRPIG